MTTTFSLADVVQKWTYLPISKVEKVIFRPKQFMAAKVHFRTALREAKKFRLDDEFVRIAVERSNPNDRKSLTSILASADMANLPFNKVWVEGDLGTRIQSQIDQNTMGVVIDQPDPSTINHRFGMLMERAFPDDASLYRVTYVNSGEEQTPQTPVMLGAYAVDTQGLGRIGRDYRIDVKQDEESVLRRNLQSILDGMAWGTTSKYFKEPGVDERLAFIANSELSRRGGGTIEHRFGPTHRLDDEEMMRILIDMSAEAAGTLRFITACFAMVNNVPINYRRHGTGGYHVVRGRNVPFFASETITIHAGRTKNVRRFVDKMFAAAASRHRRHQVRGFWRNVEYGFSSRGCQHQPVERDGDYALCGKCEHLIRWIDHHMRGDATLGYVDHNYEVTK